MELYIKDINNVYTNLVLTHNNIFESVECYSLRMSGIACFMFLVSTIQTLCGLKMDFC